MQISVVYLILGFLVAITVHEASHAWMADRLGDPTARAMGRLTLNPLAHLDIYGTVLIPLILIFLGSPIVVGWAKPVEYDPYNLANPKRDAALISLAGPASNLIIATLSALFLRLTLAPFSSAIALSGLFYALILVNVGLAIFNLIPVHPLDGGKILIGLLPKKEAYELDIFLRRYGLVLLLFLLFPLFGGNSLISIVIYPIINVILRLFIPGNPVI
ncbi:site-2 protease family protein [Patescibacteria group bacterium]|nr:site-2 protease family protein [Patescibacteria group bacterium]